MPPADIMTVTISLYMAGFIFASLAIVFLVWLLRKL
jgi:hypothetical protein